MIKNFFKTIIDGFDVYITALALCPGFYVVGSLISGNDIKWTGVITTVVIISLGFVWISNGGIDKLHFAIKAYKKTAERYKK